MPPVPVDGATGTVAEFVVAAGENAPVRAHLVPRSTPRLPIEPEVRSGARPRGGTQLVVAVDLRGALARAGYRSLVTLKGLTACRQGGSSPRPPRRCRSGPGGVRNWDYRLLLAARRHVHALLLDDAGFVRYAAQARVWLLRAVAGDPADLQIMYERRGRTAPDRVRGGLAAPASSPPNRFGWATASGNTSSTCTARCSTPCTRRVV